MDTDPDAETIRQAADETAAATVVSGSGEQPGTMIGRYKLLQPLGEGGMGAVWMAEQREPMVRRVALKIIKLGMDTQEVVARFELERQALALMDHPCIARVFDAGTTESGRPFFVMELVRGVPLTAHCDEQKLGVRERLALFIQVCQAIQHAHQKGIIHRDLKPSNILVTAGDDGEPLPKVIDFGIAKATGRALTDKTLFTLLAQIIGTPAYMSPEQAGTGPLDIDTRSDIYSLGVLLYELLTGRPPFDPRELISAGLDEMRRVIREKEPPKPSTRISSLSEKELTGLAAHCSAPAPRIIAAVRGDLDWIVMKALDKNRNRRYDSATGLAADIQRHLENQPVLARPPGSAYLLSRFVRRHKFGFAAGSAVALALIGGIAATTWALIRAETARKEADAANVANKKNLYRASMSDLAGALKAGKETFDARQKGERAVGFAGKFLSREVAALLIRSLELDPENHRAASWLYETIRRRSEWRSDLPRQRFRHDARVNCAQFSPDGTRVVTAGDDSVARVWDAANGMPLCEPLRHRDKVQSARFSPDGTKVVTASFDNTAQVWDAVSGRALGEPMRHTGRVNGARFSPNGDRVVTASDDHNGQVWDATTGKAQGPTLHHDKEVVSAEFSPDGSRVVTASADATARVWDASTGQGIGAPMYHGVLVLTARFSPDGTMVVTASMDRTARIWEAASGRPASVPMRHKADVITAVFSPDGTRVVTASWDKTARVWDTETGQAVGEPMRHDGWVISAEFSPDGAMVVTASEDKTARVWDTNTGRLLREPLIHREGVQTASFSPDGTGIVCACWDGTAPFWDAATGEARGLPLRHGGGAQSVEFHRDGTRILTASFDGTARLWDAVAGNQLGAPIRHGNMVWDAKFSRDGTRIVTSSDIRTAQVWDANSRQAVGKPMRHDDGVRMADFSPDGAKIVTASGDKTVRIWDVASGQPLIAPIKHGDFIEGVGFTPDGSRIVSVTFGRTSQEWDAVTGNAVGAPMTGVSRTRFSLDGTKSILVGLPDQTVTVCDSVTGRLLCEPIPHYGFVRGANFSPDGASLAIAEAGEPVRVWKLPTRDGFDAIAAVTPQVLAWVRNLSGLRFGEYGELELIPDEERSAALLNPGLPPGPWADLATWINTPAPQRAIDVRSKVSLRQIAERERDFNGDGSVESLKSALQYDPTVPLARLFLATAMEKPDAIKAAKVRDPNLPQRAAFLRRYDLDALVRLEGKMKNDELAAQWVRAAKHLLELPPDTKIGVDHKPTTAREEARKAAQKAVTLAPGDAAAQAVLKKAEAAQQ